MLTPFLIAAVLQVAPPAQPASPEAAAPEAPAPEDLRGQQSVTTLARASTQEERLARDTLLSFRGGTAQRARADLAQTGLPEGQRASALMALGAAGDVRDLDRIASSALAGSDVERRAAVLALGELGEPATRVLGMLALRGDRGLGGVCALALAELGSDASRQVLIQLAGDSEHPYQTQAILALEHFASSSMHSTLPGYDLRLGLRWNAARGYGFVDGRRWSSLVLEEWLSNKLFLERVVLEACVRDGGLDMVDREAVRDHLYEILITPGNPSRLGPAAEFLSLEMSDLVAAGVWLPADEGEWKVLLDAIETRHLERGSVQLLQQAMSVPALRRRAGPLIVRGGGLPNPAWFQAELSSATPERLATLIEAIGEGGDRERAEDIVNRLGTHPPERLLGRALVALVRLDHYPSRERLDEVMLSAPSQTLTGVLHGLTRSVHDPKLGVYCERVLARTDIDAERRFELELALSLAGRPRSRDALRTWLRSGGRGEDRRRVVRALGAVANETDLEVFRNLFPHETDLELNVELALALLRVRDPVAMGLLERALWKGTRNVSILAGGVLVGVHGLQALVDQLELAPPDASEQDLRRVGFAIGEWGGLAAVEIVSRRRSSTDPVVQGVVLGALSTRTR